MPAQSVKKTEVNPVKKVQAKPKPINSKLVQSKSVPVGAKIIAVLYYIMAALAILAAIGIIIATITVGGTLQEGIPGGVDILPFSTTMLTSLAIVGSIILIALAVLFFFIGRGLWKGVSWTRITAIILSAIGVVLAIVSIVGGDFGALVSLVIHAIIGGYLLFNQKVKQAFV